MDIEDSKQRTTSLRLSLSFNNSTLPVVPKRRNFSGCYWTRTAGVTRDLNDKVLNRKSMMQHSVAPYLSAANRYAGS
jgi:hypothetical protein